MENITDNLAAALRRLQSNLADALAYSGDLRAAVQDAIADADAALADYDARPRAES